MDELRPEMLGQLGGYLRGDLTASDLLVWEASVNDETSIPRPFSVELDRIALLAEEVVDGIRPENDLRELALEMTRASSHS
jgi:hypothetical protein